MWFFNNGFIGSLPNSTENFAGSDLREVYEKKLLSMPKDWYYRNLSISYKFNSLGHRCKNTEEIDLSNYLLFFGCSHTMGIGNMLEDTFPYLTAKKLNVDYYNLGLGGAGPDSMFHNLVVWMNQVKEKPKYILWQWPDLARYATINKDGRVVMHGIWEEDPEVVNFMVSGYCNGFHTSRMKFITTYLDQLNIPVIHISTDAKSEQDRPGTVYYRWIDKDNARDGMHMGIKSNDQLSNQLVDLLR